MDERVFTIASRGDRVNEYLGLAFHLYILIVKHDAF